jgi:L-alanine-DL-glutamate epimerase-like enolase superfamily enzyme
MKVCARRVALPRAEVLRIAGRSYSESEVLEVEIRHQGVSGHGEGAAFARYNESAASAHAFAEAAADDLGDDPFAHEAIMQRLPAEEFAARAAIDAALHDLCGKLLSRPVWLLLGLRQSGPPTAKTVGLADPDTVAQKAELVQAEGRFRRLKLKLGGGDGLDVERVRSARHVTDLPLQVDVNEGWTIEEALDALPVFAELRVDLCEQPLPADDPGGARLKQLSPLPIYVDEDCRTLADVKRCAHIAHGINIKLAKSGGIREAVRMVHAARALDLGVMIGCMSESSLGIAAGAALASLCDHVDLDGNLALAHDPWCGVELVDGAQTPSTAFGLGVERVLPR